MSPALQLLTGFATLASLLIGAVWVLSNRINAGNAELTAKFYASVLDLTSNINKLQVDIATMKRGEEARDEKINELWKWRLKELEDGYVRSVRANMLKGSE